MKHIKQIAIAAFVVSMALIPALSYGADIQAARDYTLQKSEAVEGDLYIAAQTNVITGEVKGDLAIGGANTLITGSVENDLLAAGGTVELLGAIGDDLRAAGGTITIGKSVGGDVVVAGGVVHIVSGAVVEGDVIAAGGQVIIDGAVNGNVKVAGGEVSINGTVAKNVSAYVDGQLMIGKSAVITGDLWYRSPNEVKIAEGAVMQGETKFEKVERPERTDKKVQAALLGLIGVVALIKLLITLTTAIIGVLLFKKVAQALVKGAVTYFGRELVRGFVILIVVPAAIVLAMISLVGIWFAFAGMMVYVLLLMIAKVCTGIMLGSILVKMMKKAKEYEVTWQSAAIGVVALELIWLVPIIGWVAVFALFLASLGSLSLMIYQKVWTKR